MAMTKCGYCGKQNEESASVCPGCGTPLKPTAIPESAINPRSASAKILTGGLLLAGGLVVSIGSYIAAGSGGTFWVATGAIAYGLFQLVLGLIDSRKTQGQLDQEEALETQFQSAVFMEAKGELDAALAIYEDLARNHANTKIGKRALDTIASMRANRASLR